MPRLGKMAAAVASFACLVVLSSLQAYEATEVPHNQVNGIVHGKVYLNPKLSVPEEYKQIIWWFDESLKILTKKWNHSVSYRNDSFHKRHKLNYYENHTLEIDQLQKQDSGIFQIDVEDNQSKTTSERIQLNMYDRIPKPRMNVIIRANKDGWCNVTLDCIVNAIQVTYRWYKNEKDFVGKSSSTLDEQLKSESPASYKCVVSNPVSEETGLVYYRSPCTWDGNIHFAFIYLAASIWLYRLAMQPLWLGLN
ncbi:CD48 antigen isoform X1 [Dermochelys coriacea]|uniref:CD48 antigen isoform X1 n=1 Tax=Dermochelys coriacea TaxID=27794 RepID=UPI001CA99B01|nr:CD48 antigen isoform X1 [Dermochelys coriacea]